MKNDNLLKRLGALGFPLFGEEPGQNANLTLADMVRSKDLRLWEGFPVVLLHSSEVGIFDFNKVNGYLKNKPSDKANLLQLMLVSLALYKLFSLKLSWANSFYKSRSKEEKKVFNIYLSKLKADLDLSVAHYKLSSQRLKTIFNSYSKQSESRLKELLSVKDEFKLEYALSQVFSPKQKDLFMKKLKGDKLTKTEKEYFSRVVKKRVLALANPELHRLAQRLLE